MTDEANDGKTGAASRWLSGGGSEAVLVLLSQELLLAPRQTRSQWGETATLGDDADLGDHRLSITPKAMISKAT